MFRSPHVCDGVVYRGGLTSGGDQTGCRRVLYLSAESLRGRASVAGVRFDVSVGELHAKPSAPSPMRSSSVRDSFEATVLLEVRRRDQNVENQSGPWRSGGSRFIGCSRKAAIRGLTANTGLPPDAVWAMNKQNCPVGTLVAARRRLSQLQSRRGAEPIEQGVVVADECNGRAGVG